MSATALPSAFSPKSKRGCLRSTNNVGQVYLVRFTKTQFNYGGVRYEQNNPRPGPPVGFWDFLTVSQEDSFTPLLEITGNTTLPCDEKHGSPIVKFAQVSVQGYMNADSGEKPSPVPSTHPPSGPFRPSISLRA